MAELRERLSQEMLSEQGILSLSSQNKIICHFIGSNLGSGQFLRYLSAIFPIVAMQSTWFLVHDPELFYNHSLPGPNFSHFLSG